MGEIFSVYCTLEPLFTYGFELIIHLVTDFLAFHIDGLRNPFSLTLEAQDLIFVAPLFWDADSFWSFDFECRSELVLQCYRNIHSCAYMKYTL